MASFQPHWSFLFCLFHLFYMQLRKRRLSKVSLYKTRHQSSNNTGSDLKMIEKLHIDLSCTHLSLQCWPHHHINIYLYPHGGI